jgi:two-component system, response regulator PdtaR
LAQKLLDDNVPVIVHAATVQVDELAARLPGALTVPRPCPPADLLHAVNRVLTPA